ncbi:MAG TPA: DUF6144 family protein [Desulfosporosinus sp.]|nr:DUF6144 family protein [Desulfosporosinus sp.]
MLDVRTNQECALYESIRKRSDFETAKGIAYGKEGSAKGEDDASWVKSSMRRLEDTFDQETVKKIRMDCQCGYGAAYILYGK